MEIQFDSIDVQCLHPVVRQSQNLEETQELRVGDGMPDIGRILGAWGQVLLRGKEWRTGQLGASCGVLVWVLYVPEDGGDIQMVESWIPFQARWDFADSGKEGKMRIQCLLRSVDARSISARKLMVRVGVSVSCDAEIQGRLQIPQPLDSPDIYLLKRQYPMQLPVESGEKMFTLDEEVSLPDNYAGIGKLLRYELRPELTDRKVIGNKAVFRGSGILHVLFCGTDGVLRSHEFEIPFSQYTELDGEYSENADVSFWLAVTNLEVAPGEGGSLHLQCGLTGQYKIFDRQMIGIAEDAYSTKMTAKPKLQQIQVPAVLDNIRDTVTYDIPPDPDCRQIVDVSWYPELPDIKRGADEVFMEFPGSLQILYYGNSGELRADVRKTGESKNYAVGSGTEIHISLLPIGKYTERLGADSTGVQVNTSAELYFVSDSVIQPVESVELMDNGDTVRDRPSLILSRSNGSGLWFAAKAAGSSVEAIMEANQLSGEPEEGRMLLIPVLK